jgi:catechol 2,3-dioxygenase-like lactoylglutathione lyase family enzyme
MKPLRYLLLLGLFIVPGLLKAAPEAIGIESLGHVGIAVSNLENALHFYVGELGLKEAFRLNRPDGKPWLVYLQADNSSTFVELFPGTKTPSSPPLPKPFHLGFFVKDLQETLHKLQASGYPLPPDAFKKAAKIEADGSLIYFIQDPDGNRIELSQVTPQSYEVKAAPALLGAPATRGNHRSKRP